MILPQKELKVIIKTLVQTSSQKKLFFVAYFLDKVQSCVLRSQPQKPDTKRGKRRQTDVKRTPADRACFKTERHLSDSQSMSILFKCLIK